MARPLKKGLAYFPFDTTLYGDRKIQRLLLAHDSIGVWIYYNILIEIYSKEGYYIEAHPEVCFNIAFSMRIPEKQVKEVLSYCLQVGLFDKIKWRKNKIYTSSGIQRRYFEMVKRNKSTMKGEYLTESFEQELAKLKKVSADKILVTETTIPIEEKQTTDPEETTPAKGNGNGNGKVNENKNKKEKKKEKEKEKTNKKKTEKKGKTSNLTYEKNNPNPVICDNTAYRKAQLQQMATAAIEASDQADRTNARPVR